MPIPVILLLVCLMIGIIVCSWFLYKIDRYEHHEVYEWKSAMDIIEKYPVIEDAVKDGWEFCGGAFRRKV